VAGALLMLKRGAVGILGVCFEHARRGKQTCAPSPPVPVLAGGLPRSKRTRGYRRVLQKWSGVRALALCPLAYHLPDCLERASKSGNVIGNSVLVPAWSLEPLESLSTFVVLVGSHGVCYVCSELRVEVVYCTQLPWKQHTITAIDESCRDEPLTVRLASLTHSYSARAGASTISTTRRSSPLTPSLTARELSESHTPSCQVVVP
jgi:hypothetical protein